MKKLSTIIFFSFCILFASCSSVHDISEFYTQYQDINDLNDVVPLEGNDKIELQQSSNIEKDTYIAVSNWNLCLGNVSYEGPDRDTKAIEKLAEKMKATLVLYNISYLRTTYSSAYGSINSRNRYNHAAVFFVKMTKPGNSIGFVFRNITFDMQKILKRNTGAEIDIVYVNTPAFYANIVSGDIVTAVNGQDITTANDLNNAIKDLKHGDSITLTLLRQKGEVNVMVKM